MKEYKKIPFNRIKDISEYTKRKLKNGCAIFWFLVDEDEKQIVELVSYANDKENKSYYRCYMDDGECLENYVITYRIVPYYAYKDMNRKKNDLYITAAIDIKDDSQDVISFYTFTSDLADMEKYFSGAPFKFSDEESLYHYEFFVSTSQCDIGNFGGPMEIGFIETWMKEMGYYKENN